MTAEWLRIAAVLMAVSTTVLAETGDIPHYHCFQQASERYGVDVRLVLAVASVESGFAMDRTNRNDNGSTDHGIMQINSSWKDELSVLGISWKDVSELPCINIHVGAWILATNFSRKGVSWYSVGAYNAGHENTKAARRHRAKYALKVYRAARSIPSHVMRGAYESLKQDDMQVTSTQ